MIDHAEAVKWALNVTFALLIALSFTCYGQAFRKVGGPPETSVSAVPAYVLNVLLNPWFLVGVALAFAGSILRFALFARLGIARSALVSELSLVFMLILAYAIFHDQLRFPRDYIGAALILFGSYLVGGR